MSGINIFLNAFKKEITDAANYIFNREGPVNEDFTAYLASKSLRVDGNIDEIYSFLSRCYKSQSSLDALCEKHYSGELLEKTSFYIDLLQKESMEFIKHHNQYFSFLREQINADFNNCIFSKILFSKFLIFCYDKGGDWVKVFTSSVLIYLYKDAKHFDNIYRTAIDSSKLDCDQMLFLIYQAYRIYTTQKIDKDDETDLLQRTLYRKVYNIFKSMVGDNYKYIPANERNKDVVVVFTGQILGLNFAPSKTTLERCYALVKHLGKKVILINTGETYEKGVIPFYRAEAPVYIEEYVNYNFIKYKDLEIPFYQVDCQMPDLDEIRAILSSVNSIKPYFILSLGNFNITADLCGMIAPVLTTAFVFSSLPVTESRFLLIGSRIDERELKAINKLGFGRENIVENLFTFDFTPQSNTYNRAAFNLPPEKFLIAVIGLRLDREISEEFVDALLSAADYGAELVFIGNFERFAEIAQGNKKFADNAKYLGMQSDVLAVLELCDLYVNPKRQGGGSSAGEAMFKGLPAVSFAGGDVALVVGEDFLVDSYEEMRARIIRYATDKQFYAQMSARARKRAEVIMDTGKELANTIKLAEERSIF